MNYGKALRTLREARGMSPEDLAEALRPLAPHWRNSPGASAVLHFEFLTDWWIIGLPTDFATALRVPLSVFMLFATEDDELGVWLPMAQKVRELTLELLAAGEELTE